MKKTAFFLLLFVSTICFSQENSKATINASGDLVGITVKSDFDQLPYSVWFKTNYDSYSLDAKTVKTLKKGFKNITIKAFMATWCRDSKKAAPQLIKLLEETGFDFTNLEMITVSRSKQTPDHLEKDFDLKTVPTILFYKDGKEIGRYLEYPRETLEKDILKIVTGKKYQNSLDKSKQL